MSDAPTKRNYTPDGAVLSAFLQDFSFFSAIRGPVGSGKSVACCIKAYMVAHLQQPGLDNIRKTKGVIIRRTFDQLKRTTLQTWLDWYPVALYGEPKMGPPIVHVIREDGHPYCWACRITPMPDAQGRVACLCGHEKDWRPTTIEMEAHFLPVEDESDVEKLKSFEITWFWVNEGRYFEKAIVDAAIERLGRYPKKERDPKTGEVLVTRTWTGGWLDTNAPEEDHWIPIMEGTVQPPEWMDEDDVRALERPDSWHFYQQPAALLEIKGNDGEIDSYEENPLVENRFWQDEGYWLRLSEGKTRGYIDTELRGQLGVLRHGKPVWPTFSRDRNVARNKIEPNPHMPLVVGFDSTGQNPAAIFLQQSGLQWRVIGELIGRGVTNEQFAPLMRTKIARMFPGLKLTKVDFWRDPHMQKSDVDDRTVDMVFRKFGMRLRSAPGGNGIKHRTETVANLWDTRGGRPGILISPECIGLIAACEGGYHYRKLRVSGGIRYTETPEKDHHADPSDGLQYGLLGAGEGKTMMRGSEKRKFVDTRRRYRPGRRGKRTA